MDQYKFDVKSKSGKGGFESFQEGDSGPFYFHYNDAKGNAILYSQAYQGVAGRDNGIRSVIKNSVIEERYSIVEENGKFYFSLKAGNKQEIARSPYFNSMAELNLAKAYLFGNAVDEAASFELDAKEILADDAVAKAVAANKLTASGTGSDTDSQSDRLDDDYLPCDEYRARISDSKSADHKGFIIFTHENGKHYFAVLDADGDLYLRSEGYPTTAARDNGVQSVIKNIEINERYKAVEIKGKSYLSLRAGNNQEIARSCSYDSLAAAEGRIGKSFLAAAVATAASMSSSENVEDDYLVCGEYRDRIADSKSDKYPGFITFQHKNGKYYFALLDSENDLYLRSEGYPTIAARDNGVESVIKNKDNQDRYKTEEIRGMHFLCLRAGNNQEIARSCPYKTLAEADSRKGKSYVALALAAAGVAAATQIELPKTVEAPKVEPIAAAPIETAKMAAAPIIEEEAGGGWLRWLPWLLGALLLGGLLWWLMKGCDKPKADATVETPAAVIPTDSVSVDSVQADTAATVVAPAAVQATCNCSGNAEPIFNIPVGKTPKKLPRLGTNPEFARYGDLHKQSPAEFLAFLKDRASKSEVDKSFLDRVTKAMGYTNGVSDLTDAAISEYEFPVGTVGNLGWGAAHNTGYDQLPDNERDRKAFKIEGNGGCALYFMKTCGNHMFPDTNCNK